MKIKNIRKRRRISKLSTKNYPVKELSELEIKVLEKRGRFRDCKRKYRCVQYVLGCLMQEPWAKDPPELFWDNGVAFLRSKGYEVVNKPENCDIVVYRDVKTTMLGAAIKLFSRTTKQLPETTIKSAETKHIGLYEDGKVISKWGNMHVLIHKIEDVPLVYGNDVVFMRKED